MYQYAVVSACSHDNGTFQVYDGLPINHENRIKYKNANGKWIRRYRFSRPSATFERPGIIFVCPALDRT